MAGTTSVLAVDDDQQILSVLNIALNECGYKTTCIKDPHEALDVLSSQHVDVMLCDVLMPEMSGLELLERSQNLKPNMVVIMMSGMADMSTAREAVKLGAGDFLIKPFSLMAVPIAIERNLLLQQIETNRIIEQRNKVLLESIKALSAAMDAKEHNTVEHSERIATVALMIADAICLSPAERSNIELAAYMHDIGKIGVSESVLLKPDKLSDVEWAEMKTHPDTGSHILSNIEELTDLAKIIRHHHERFDGNGYPDGLSGTQIPLLSRILTVADSFDAMISDRPYRRGMSYAEAMRQLKEGAGTQFDAGIVRVFIKAWEHRHKKN